jgi:uncharacterized Tic20 family protein
MAETTIRTEDKLMAAAAHASILLQGFGMLVGVLVYITQRERSRYAAKQALQAAVYQLITMIVIMGLWLVWGVLYGIGFALMIPAMESNAAPGLGFWLLTFSFVAPLFLMKALGLYGLWGAIRALGGRPFRYAIIGQRLEESGLWREQG